METRFEDDQPWNFGWTPSMYFDSLQREARERIKFKYYDIKHFDELFELTLNCHGVRSLDKHDILKMLNGRIYDDCDHLTALTYCKPLSMECFYRNQASVLSEMINNELNLSSYVSYYKCSLDSAEIILGFSEEITNTYRPTHADYNKGRISLDEFNLTEGILLGFPLGDVFSFVIKEKYEPKYHDCDLNPYLLHSIYHISWSESWKNEVGFSGEKHLVNVYKKTLGDFALRKQPRLF